MNKQTEEIKRTESRFWKKVNKEGPTPEHMPHLGMCWVWTACKNSSGGKHCRGEYGFFVHPSGTLAHRYSWELHNGAIGIGLKVLHHCDNKLCIRPSHIFLGTSKDNIQDLVKKGLKITPKGESVIGHKLTEKAAIEIYNAPNTYGILIGLSEKFKVSRSTIKAVRMGKAWKQVTQSKL